MGVKDEPDLGEGMPYMLARYWLMSIAEGQKDDGKNYKADSQFSSHLLKSEGQSAFAKNRTLKQQREYLPAFAVREELMRMIRDHQGELRRSCS